MSVCYEAGPTGYGLYRQVRAFGYDCCVVAPSLIPVRAGERVEVGRALRAQGSAAIHVAFSANPASPNAYDRLRRICPIDFARFRWVTRLREGLR